MPLVGALLFAMAGGMAAARPVPSRLPPEVTDLRDQDYRAVSCAAYLGHEINASPHAARPPLVAAMQAWRVDLERRRPHDEAEQYFASTFAVLHDTPARTRRAAAVYCLTHAPAVHYRI
jgi:hypothetical protein